MNTYIHTIPEIPTLAVTGAAARSVAAADASGRAAHQAVIDAQTTLVAHWACEARAATLVEARKLWETYRDEEGLGASETPKLLTLIDGVEYRLSYNGRAWLGDQEIGTKTCECGALDPVWHQREDAAAIWQCPRCAARRTGL